MTDEATPAPAPAPAANLPLGEYPRPGQDIEAYIGELEAAAEAGSSEMSILAARWRLKEVQRCVDGFAEACKRLKCFGKPADELGLNMGIIDILVNTAFALAAIQYPGRKRAAKAPKRRRA